MKLITNIQIKHRILLLVLIPVFVALFFAFQRYQQANETLTKMKQLESLQQYISHVSPLIAALYQERLMSKLYIGPGDNTDIGSQFKTQLENSQDATEAPLAEYIEYIKDTEKFNAFPKLKTDLENILASIPTYRTIKKIARDKKHLEIDEKSGEKIRVLREMNALVVKLIDSSQQVVLLSSSNETLSLLTRSYQNVSNAQNYMMLLIGNIYEVMSAKVSLPTFANIARQVGQERIYLAEFEGVAPTDLLTFYRAELKNNPVFKEAADKYEQVRRVGISGINKAFEGDINTWLAQGDTMIDAYDSVVAEAVSSIDDAKDKILRGAKGDVNQTISVIIVLIVVLSAVSFFIIASINEPLKQLMKDFSTLAESKDMTLRTKINGNNELSSVASAFNSLIKSFEQTLLKIRQKILTMDEITHQVSGSVNTSMTLIEEQKIATDSISVAVNQMASTIHEVSQMTSETSNAVKRANHLSVSGEEDAKSSCEAMEQLVNDLGSTSDVIGNLNEEASQISNIVQVIKGISEQTNLLALNAAIEAARAGEMGRGFAVVADEVRELSKRTNDSTGQIQDQIETLIKGVRNTLDKIQGLQAQGSAAVNVVEKSSGAFLTIKTELESITDMTNQIAVATEQQTQVANEINERVHTIKDESEKLVQQGTQNRSDTQGLLKNQTLLKEDIQEFDF